MHVHLIIHHIENHLHVYKYVISFNQKTHIILLTKTFDQKNTSMALAMTTKILMSIVATAMLIELALAVDHSVGASSGGWDTSTDLGSWASLETFTVGDNLGMYCLSDSRFNLI